MKKIILDTNFLLIPRQFKVDIFSEISRICPFKYKVCIIDKSIEELKKIIINQKGKNKLSALLGLVLVTEKNVSVIKTRGRKSADDLIVAEADKNTIVATQDAGLKKRLKENGISLIVLKGKTHLALLEG